MATGFTCVPGYNYGYQEITGININNIVLLGLTSTTGTTGTTGTKGITGTIGITGPTETYRTPNLSVTFGSPIIFSSNINCSGQVKKILNNTINQIWGTFKNYLHKN